MCKLFMAAALLLPLWAAGQNTLAIVGGTLIDGTGRTPIKNALVIIEGQLIAYAGPNNPSWLAQVCERVDATGKFIIPGLADMHNHMTNGTFELGRPASNFEQNLRCLQTWGVTMTFIPGMDLDTLVNLKQLARDDPGKYPHLGGTGPSFAARDGHGARYGNTPGSVEEARETVRKLKATGIDAIKVHYDDLSYITTQARPMLSQELMAAIIDAAHREGMKAYVHAPILKFAKEALRAGADGLVHGIVSEPIDAEFIGLMKKNDAVYITTHSIFYSAADLGSWANRVAKHDAHGRIPKSIFQKGMSEQTVKEWEERWDKLEFLKTHLSVLGQNVRSAVDAGITVVVGSDTSNSGTGILLGLASQVELTLLVEAGLTPQEVLVAASINAARMVGKEEELGSILAGKVADILILDSDPLQDIANVREIYRFIRSGHLYDPATWTECSNRH